MTEELESIITVCDFTALFLVILSQETSGRFMKTTKICKREKTAINACNLQYSAFIDFAYYFATTLCKSRK